MAHRIRPLLLALVPLALAGCFSRGAVLARRVDPGPPLVDTGGDAYRVWHDRAGWHLRAGSDVVRHFHGEIRGGDAGDVQRVDLPEDAVEDGRGRILFSFLADEEAGFDWKGGGCVSLALYIDGDARPLRVFVGEFGASPSRMPARVCS